MHHAQPINIDVPLLTGFVYCTRFSCCGSLFFVSSEEKISFELQHWLILKKENIS